MMSFQILADVIESFFHVIGELKQLEFAFVDRAGAHQVPPINSFVPILPAVNQNQVVRRKLVGLQKCEHLPKLVHGAESTWKNNQRFGHLREPQLAHEKIMKKEIQFRSDIPI